MARKRRKRGGNGNSSGDSSPAGSCPSKRKTSIRSRSERSLASERTPRPASIRDDVTPTNQSDVNGFGASMENIAAAAAVKVKLPPIMVKSIPLDQLSQGLKSIGVAAEYKLCRIGIKVLLNTKADFDKTFACLKRSQAEFFTHDIPGEKPFKAVVRGLPDVNPEELVSELREHYKLAPIAAYKMLRRDTKQKYRDSLFLVHFPKGTVTINALRAVRTLSSIVVRWEPYRGGGRDVTQCQRCMHFGHGTKNCNMAPRCNVCGQNHITSSCPVEGAAAFKCANCDAPHQASDKQCPKREAYKQIRKQASSSNQPGRQVRAPVFKQDDFPPLDPRNTRPQSQHPHHPGTVPAGGQWSSPPGFRSATPAGNTAAADLFSAEELMGIFISMSGALRQCRTKPEQIQVLGTFIIRYGV